jgi:hypothetical protein
LAINKYYYLNKFINTADTELLAQGFNERYNSFFEQIEMMIFESEENLLYQIQQFNKWANIIPSNHELQFIEINEELQKEIHDSYHFSKVSKTNNSKILYKNITNCYFTKHLIISEQKGKHSKFIVNEAHREMFEFGKENLKSINRPFRTTQEILKRQKLIKELDNGIFDLEDEN